MIDREAQAREVMEAISRVLLEDWDPIGVKDEPMARDEYNRYIGDVYRLLTSGATATDIAQHLLNIEVDRMELGPGSVQALLPVAEKLLSLNTRLKGGSVA